MRQTVFSKPRLAVVDGMSPEMMSWLVTDHGSHGVLSGRSMDVYDVGTVLLRAAHDELRWVATNGRGDRLVNHRVAFSDTARNSALSRSPSMSFPILLSFRVAREPYFGW
jgi:hypothetical protein